MCLICEICGTIKPLSEHLPKGCLRHVESACTWSAGTDLRPFKNDQNVRSGSLIVLNFEAKKLRGTENSFSQHNI